MCITSIKGEQVDPSATSSCSGDAKIQPSNKDKRNKPSALSSSRIIPFISGSLMSINFLVFWVLPIMLMGLVWKHALKYPLKPLYDMLDTNRGIRWFAEQFIYNNPKHADYFVTSVLLLINSAITLGTVFRWQFVHGSLPMWLIYAYYFSWVGIGGRIMGAAYALAHKEGHNHNLYKKWIKYSIGNLFENWLGLFYGNVPYNFTTSHIFVHHKLDGGPGDTFYEWDIDRTSLADFMLYIHRIFMHMIGVSSLRFFNAHEDKRNGDLLYRGMVTYWAVAVVIGVITRSPSFVFWIYLQPMFCMSYFLALLNVGFHGFIEFTPDGKSIPCVNATTIIEGDDDYFGEDDHMAHHYNQTVYYRDLPAHQASKVDEFTTHKASVFRGLSIVELSIFILVGLWDKLADHYVDYSGKMSRAEIMEMLKTRAQRTETTYERYQAYMSNPTKEERNAIAHEASLAYKRQ